MRSLLLIPVALLLFSNVPLVEASSLDAAQTTASPKPDDTQSAHRHAVSRAAHKRAEEAKAIAAEDSESRIGQVPAGVLAPGGERIPEVGPTAPATDTSNKQPKANTADCTSNPDSKECYAATQQGKAK